MKSRKICTEREVAEDSIKDNHRSCFLVTIWMFFIVWILVCNLMHDGKPKKLNFSIPSPPVRLMLCIDVA